MPNIEAVQCLRPTRSFVLHLQMLGRGLRPSAGKNCLIILDHTENWIYHSLPDEEHEWSLDPISLGSDNQAIECSNCQHCFRPQPHEQRILEATCRNCGTIIQLEEAGSCKAVERVVEHDNGAALEEIDLEADPTVVALLQNLKHLQEQHGYKAMWVYHQLIERHPNVSLEDLRECAKLLGYKQGRAWYRWQELQQRQAA